MNQPSPTWADFTKRASATMRDALNDVITLEEASAYFESAEAITSPELRQYIVRAIWEIDGNRHYYMELMELFEKGIAEEKLIGEHGLGAD